jgi:hypothetical protein
MRKEHKEIISLLSDFLEKNPELRFGQALTNLEVLEFVDKSSPPQHYMLRDIYQDSDTSILEIARLAKSKLELVDQQTLGKQTTN